QEHVRLLMIGGGNQVMLDHFNLPRYTEELKELAAALHIADKIIWTGYYPSDSDLPSVFLWAADACVLPFDSGAYMNNSTTAAAAAHALPIITTRAPIVEHQLIDKQNVLLFPPKDDAALASALELVISSSDARQQLRRGAVALSREWFGWEGALTRTIDA